MELEAPLLAARLVGHLLTTIVIASYVGGENHRKAVGFAAFLLAGSSFAESMRIVVNWDAMVASPVQPWLPVIIFAMLAIIVRARGNLAKILQVP